MEEVGTRVKMAGYFSANSNILARAYNDRGCSSVRVNATERYDMRRVPPESESSKLINRTSDEHNEDIYKRNILVSRDEFSLQKRSTSDEWPGKNKVEPTSTRSTPESFR